MLFSSILSEIIAVVKANAYGHGSVQVARFLEKHGISHFAVATALEGEELRLAGIHGNIQVFGEKLKLTCFGKMFRIQLPLELFMFVIRKHLCITNLTQVQSLLIHSCLVIFFRVPLSPESNDLGISFKACSSVCFFCLQTKPFPVL